jgi:hypothetical protein
VTNLRKSAAAGLPLLLAERKWLLARFHGERVPRLYAGGVFAKEVKPGIGWTAGQIAIW